MPGRKYSSANTNYRYGFNGKEKSAEITSNDYDYGARIYDSRLGRFLSLDPLEKKYPYQSSYVYAENNPIRFIDIDGKGAGDPITVSYTTPNGGIIKLPTQSTVSYLGNLTAVSVHDNIVEVKNPTVGGKEISFSPGAINTFTYNKEIYEAKFNTETGKFVGFFSQSNAKNHITETRNTLPDWNVYSPSKSDDHIKEMGGFALSLNPGKKNPYVIAAAVIGTIYLVTTSKENLALSTSITKGLDDVGGYIVQMAQKGFNRGKMDADELARVKAKVAAGTATALEMQKYKRDQKNRGDRPSRQSKDKK